MEIVIQSLLRDACRLPSPIHVRYCAKATKGLANPDHSKESGVFLQTSTTNGPSSYVVIQRDYAYLEPVIRTTFEDAQDVQVFMDRRFRERRKPGNGNTTSDRRAVLDRRASTPIVDILININGVPS